MEYWNIGFGGRRSVFIGLTEANSFKLDHLPLLIPNTPLYHHYYLTPNRPIFSADELTLTCSVKSQQAFSLDNKDGGQRHLNFRHFRHSSI
jgi:hypothetical protein